MNAKQMLNSFDNFAPIDNTNKYKAEIATYISSIKHFKGFGVKVHLISPYDSCDREIQEHFKSVDADIVGARMGLSTALMECVMFLPEPMRHNWEVLTNPNLINKYVQNRIFGVYCIRLEAYLDQRFKSSQYVGQKREVSCCDKNLLTVVRLTLKLSAR